MCHGQYHTLDQHIGFAFAKEPAEGQIGLDVGKGALRLDGPVETQQDTGFFCLSFSGSDGACPDRN